MPEWISRKIISDIQRAIEATDRSTHVFYITGEGGTGKTVLLRQIGQKLGSKDGMNPCLPWSGILDLYHSDVNTNSGLEARLSQALETAGEFQTFRDQRDAYAARREAGLIGEELEAERSTMAKKFAECMNSVTRWSRVVIALDTTERIQYEVDEIQKLCNMEDESTTVKAWLLDQLQRWQNCVVLLVGRPEEKPHYLGKALAKALADKSNVHYETRTLSGFDEDESQAYFTQKEKVFPVLRDLDDPDFRHRLWQVTEGIPIRLDLAIEVIQYGLGFDQFRRKIETESLKEIRKEIDRLLIDHVVMNDEPDRSVRDILRYLAVARRGLNAELLHHLAGTWDLNECQTRLDAVAERSFIKHRPADGRLFLHDEMYELCDTYLLQPEEVQHLSRRIVEWYDQQIAASDDKQNLQVDSVLYRLRANPGEGYHWYAQQDEYAIRAVEVGFDMRLRNEVMAFLKSRSPIDQRLLNDTPGLEEEFNCDSAARWVKRLMVRGENGQAVDVAKKVVNLQPGPCSSDDPGFELARADLAVYHAQALIYTARTKPAIDLLRQVIITLEGEHKPGQLVPQEAKTYADWRRNLVLGRGYNNLGYSYWHLGYYEAALKVFRSALPYFRASELWEEMANTNDNMGRVYALLGYPTRAGMLVDEGLAQRRRLKRDYRIALSLNSRAIVHLLFDELHHAKRLAEEALDTCDKLGTQRGIGLASITLGRTLRKMGGLWTTNLYSFEDCNNFFRDSARHLEKAVQIFEGVVGEPVRLVEALNELGCTYRDRTRLAQEMTPDSPLARTIAAEAIKYLEKCIDLADTHEFDPLYVDACEDLAQTYCLRQDYHNARVWLRKAKKRVPEAYKFKENKKLPEMPAGEEPVEAFWLQMGKIELLQGNITFDTSINDDSQTTHDVLVREAIQHYVLSVAYFEQYSERAPGLRVAFKQIYERLKDAPLDDLKYLHAKVVPEIAQRYGIDSSSLSKFFEDTLGLD